ncbi:hypothetical protein F4804DRAFT_348340 [Jackrogersella minutella]|nr:hypothetical protein F4804DRAFT_348340 [Jackrogersella minutella]
MCYQIIERYSACHCLYYQHAVDRCSAYGQPGHHVSTRTMLVGENCQQHAQRAESSNFQLPFASKSKSQQLGDDLDSQVRVDSIDNTNLSNDPEASGASDDDLSSVEAFLFDDDDGSSVTSSSSVGSLTALERFTNGFLYDKYLHGLWAQIFLRTTSLEEAKEQISLLILRYSLDLNSLARKQSASEDSTSLKIRASKFVKRKRRYIAQEVYNQFWLPFRVLSQHLAESAPVEKIIDEESDSDDNQQPEVDRFLALNEFMFETEPFHYFRENVRLFVAEKASVNSLKRTWFDSMRMLFDNYVVSARSKNAHGEAKRLFWTCECGLQFYDDYIEIQGGALNRLKEMLSTYGVRSRSPGDLESNNSRPGQSYSNSGKPPSGSSRSKVFDVRLPQYWQRQDHIEPGKCSRMVQAGPDNTHNYLLACLPFGRWISKLHQPEVCTINSDQDFFSLLRMLYSTNHRKLSLSWIRRVKGIHFVQFDLHRTEIASIRDQPAIPPEDLLGQYQYDPMPAQLMPPIGSNMLVHFFENPTHASVLPDLYRRVPKKMREKLTPCQITGMSVGWGIQFVEGIDTFKFFLCGCTCFLLCLIIAVGWSAAKQDIQGGFGIGGFLLAFMVFCGGIVHSSLDS